MDSMKDVIKPENMVNLIRQMSSSKGEMAQLGQSTDFIDGIFKQGNMIKQEGGSLLQVSIS